MKQLHDLNPERDYFAEALFKSVGAYFYWLVKGRKTSIKEEYKNTIRNVITSIFLYAILLFIIFFIIIF